MLGIALIIYLTPLVLGLFGIAGLFITAISALIDERQCGKTFTFDLEIRPHHFIIAVIASVWLSASMVVASYAYSHIACLRTAEKEQVK
jgi:hypothetical protein